METHSLNGEWWLRLGAGREAPENEAGKMCEESMQGLGKANQAVGILERSFRW